MSRKCPTERIAGIIRKALKKGEVVEIEGLGTFRPATSGFEFIPEVRSHIFLAYVQEDLAAVQRLFDELKGAGYHPWLDKMSLLPGQNWPRAIDRAIEDADFFIPIFSRRSVLKRGGFQSELRFALDCASKRPLDDIFVVPIRLDACAVPERIHKHLHHVDLFPAWEHGVGQILGAIDHELARRRRRELQLAS